MAITYHGCKVTKVTYSNEWFTDDLSSWCWDWSDMKY